MPLWAGELPRTRPWLSLTFRSGSSGSFGVPANRDESHPPPSVETLDAYALERWEVRPPRPDLRPLHALTKRCCADHPALHGVVRYRPHADEALPGCSRFAATQRPHGERPVSIRRTQWQPAPPNPERSPRSGGALQITSLGFQFLLHPPHAQLWELLLQYLRMVEVSGGLLLRDARSLIQPCVRSAKWTSSRCSASCSCCPPWNWAGCVRASVSE